jgi:hypothetical protein
LLTVALRLPRAAAAAAAAAAFAAALLLPEIPPQAVLAYIDRMRYVPTASTDAVLGLFGDTIIKYHMLFRWAAVTHQMRREAFELGYNRSTSQLHLLLQLLMKALWVAGTGHGGRGSRCCAAPTLPRIIPVQ